MSKEPGPRLGRGLAALLANEGNSRILRRRGEGEGRVFAREQARSGDGNVS